MKKILFGMFLGSLIMGAYVTVLSMFITLGRFDASEYLNDDMYDW